MLRDEKGQGGNGGEGELSKSLTALPFPIFDPWTGPTDTV